MAKAKELSKPEQMELSFGPYQFTRSGLVVVGESSQAQWEHCGEGLKAFDEARQWAIGDWLNDGKRHYGDGLYKRAAELTGLDEGTLRKFASIAGVIELLLRSNKLFWYHHYEVASIKLIGTDAGGKLCLSDEPDKEKMAELLASAAPKGGDSKLSLSVVELRKEVQKYKEWQREYINTANEPEKYSVIYADPPWQYSSGDQHSTEEQDITLEDHYPSMSLREICLLPQAQLAATDSILFLWCTSPTLEEALQVVSAWGFSYKASMVWDKVAHNVGNYVSVRHELLLICKKGQPPKVPKLVDSVYVEERTIHSRKPAYFRNLIDELYPNGKRIELFAREQVEGWEVWGNETANV